MGDENTDEMKIPLSAWSLHSYQPFFSVHPHSRCYYQLADRQEWDQKVLPNSTYLQMTGRLERSEVFVKINEKVLCCYHARCFNEAPAAKIASNAGMGFII